MSDLRVAFVDNSTMDSVANKLKAWVEGALPADLVSRLFIASAHRGNSGVDYHEDTGVNGAIDIDGSDSDMRDASRILIQDADLLLEMIHTTPFSDDNGFYVKNEQVVGPDFYGAATNAQHLNHIHLASNESMCDQLRARRPQSAPPAPTPAPTPAPPAPVSHTDTVTFYPDVSEYQGDMSLAGVQFASARASIGGRKDAKYDHFVADSVANNYFLMPYHFIYSSQSVPIGEQVRVALEVAGSRPAMLDLEPDGSPPQPDLADAAEFVRQYRSLGGVLNVVYLPHWFWEQMGSPDLAPLRDLGLHLVSSNYTSYSADGPGWAGYGGMTPAVWQYSDSQALNGQAVDYNAFKGSVEELIALVGGAGAPTPVPAPPVQAPVPVDTGFPPFNRDDTYYTVQSGDNLSAIADNYGTTIEAIVAINTDLDNPDLIYPGQVLRVKLGGGSSSAPAPQYQHYWVQPGDTLTSIAADHGTSVAHILSVNNDIPNPDVIYVGQELIF